MPYDQECTGDPVHCTCFFCTSIASMHDSLTSMSCTHSDSRIAEKIQNYSLALESYRSTLGSQELEQFDNELKDRIRDNNQKWLDLFNRLFSNTPDTPKTYLSDIEPFRIMEHERQENLRRYHEYGIAVPGSLKHQFEVAAGIRPAFNALEYACRFDQF